MGVRNAGEDYPLDDDSILKINSPQKHVGGPYAVVTKSVESRFAIVAMDWYKKPTLGIRWFYGNCGYPNTRGYSTWLMAPEFVKKYLVSEDVNLTQLIEDFLTKNRLIDDFLKKSQLIKDFLGREEITGKKITGEELKRRFKEFS